MPSTYEHKALIEQLRKLSADKSASENPSEESLNTSHPSGDSSVDDDGTMPATTGLRASENEAAIAAGYPEGTEKNIVNDASPNKEQYAPGAGEGDVPQVLADDPQDPPTSHPAGGKEAAVEALLKEANEIGSALRDLIKSAEMHGEDKEEEKEEEDKEEDKEAEDKEADDKEASNCDGGHARPKKKKKVKASEYGDDEEDDKEEDDDDEAGKEAAKEAAEELAKFAAEARKVEETLKEAAERDADSFSSVLFALLGDTKSAEMMGDEGAEDEAEEALAQMAMADAAPAEEEPAEEEAPAEEAMADAAPAEESLSPEEQMMLMQLLSAEGMGAEDVAAYGKMSAMIESGDISVDGMSKAQQDYFNTCSESAKSAQAKFDNWKASSVLASELNGIYNRGAK